jgi:hypothetical protein
MGRETPQVPQVVPLVSPRSCPLLSHRFGDAGEGLAAKRTPVRAAPRRFQCVVVPLGLPFARPFACLEFVEIAPLQLDDVCGLKQRQVLQPQACAFLSTVSKLVRLHDLVRFSVFRAHHTHRVLHSNAMHGSMDQPHEKLSSLLLAAVSDFLFEMPGTACREVCAGWESDEHVPVSVRRQELEHVLLQMPFWSSASAWHDVAAVRFVAKSAHVFRYGLALFASHQNLHADGCNSQIHVCPVQSSVEWLND